MNTRIHERHGACPVRLMMVLGAAVMAVPLSPATFGSDASPMRIEEVVVTAQRKATALLDTPVAVSAFSSDTLDSRAILDLRDLKTLVPGMQVADSYGTAAITIRGVGTIEVLQGADPGVAYHVDGVYLGRSHLAATAFFDVQQVEILRGPQGTLFGRNSTGGTVNFIPARPTDTFFASINGAVEADPFGHSIEGVLSGPVGEQLTGRLSVRHMANEGYSENRHPSGPDRLDDRSAFAMRAQLASSLTESLDLLLTVERYDLASNGSAHFLLGSPSGAPTPGELAGGTLPNIDRRELHTNYGKFDLDYTGTTLKLVWDAEAGRLSSSSSYYTSSSRFLNDFDGTEVDFTSTAIDNDADQFYQEMLFEPAAGDDLDVVIGANFYLESSKQAVNVPINFPDNSIAVVIDSDIDTRSFAGFAHATYSVSESWRIFGGGRYTHDEKRAERSNNFVGMGKERVDWNAVTYEVGASKDIGANSLGYLKYAKGYKGGGFESSAPGTPPFDPEYSKSWEVGFKGEYFDRRAQVALAAFRTDYTDLQVNQIVGVSNTVANAASATLKGAEIEIAARLRPSLSAELAYAYLDARFDEFMTADAARPELGQLDLSNNHLRNSPKHSTSVGLYQTFSGIGPGELTLGGRYYWQDRMYFSEFNLDLSSQRAVGRSDLSLEYSTLDGAWKVSVFLVNLTDETVFNDVVVVSDLLGSAAFAKLDAGRRFGASLVRTY